LHLQDEETVTLFCKFVNDMNQYMKNIYGSEPFYNFENGLMISNSPNQVTSYITATPIFTKKNQSLDEILKHVNFTIEGSTYYSFYKEYKKNITEVIIEPNYIKFITNLPLVELVIPKINEGNKPFKDSRLEETFGNFGLSESQVKEIVELGNSPFTIYLDFGNEEVSINNQPEDNYLQLVFNKKFLVGLKSLKNFTSSVSIEVYDFDSEKNLYLMEIVVVSKDIKVRHYMVVTDVIEE
jgi:hypothetical protein